MQTTIYAGDTLSFDASYPDYPSTDGWTLTYKLVPASGSVLSFAATASGSDFTVTVLAATTTNWATGDYGWFALVSKGAERYRVDEGRTTVKTNPASASAHETRSQARIGYEAVCAVLNSRASKDQQRYAINGRELWRMTVADLIQLKSHFAMQMASEDRDARASAGLPDKRRTYARFSNRA